MGFRIGDWTQEDWDAAGQELIKGERQADRAELIARMREIREWADAAHREISYAGKRHG